MSNYYNLPRQAAFSITSINGKRCTAVPRAVQGTKAPSSAPAAETTKAAPARTTAEAEDPQAADPTTRATGEGAVPIVITTAGSPSNQISKTFLPLTSVPTPEAISDTTIQSQGRPNPTSAPSGGIDDENGNSTPAESSTQPNGAHPTNTNNKNPGETNDATLISAPNSSGSNTGAIVGGVIGVLGVLAIIGMILFFCRRRRRRRRELGLQPLESATREKFFEIDNGSIGPSKKTTKWKREISSRAENAAWGFKTTIAGFGTSLKETVSRDRSYTPSVDLVQGNDRYYEGSVSQHSRNNSSVRSASTGGSSLREKLARWRERFGEVWRPQKQGTGMRGPMSQTSSMVESRVPTDRYRDSDQSGSVATTQLGLTLMNSQTSDLLRLENQPRDPFEDPYADEDPFCDPKLEALKPTKSTSRPLSNPFAAGDNPFADPVVPVSVITRPPQTYIQHVRQSRGSSLSSAPSSKRSSRNSDLISFIDRPTSMGPRFPSTVVASPTSERDTIYSSFSAERRGKGRSDPFDLDRPELFHLSPKNRPSNQRGSTVDSPISTVTSISRVKSMIDQNKARGHHRYDSSIRYSSGVDSLEDWGDPGPDLSTDSMRGNASSQGGGVEFDVNDLRRPEGEEVKGKVYTNHKINGSLMEIKVNLGPISNAEGEAKRDLERRRQLDNVSPVSALSEDGVVGKQ